MKQLTLPIFVLAFISLIYAPSCSNPSSMQDVMAPIAKKIEYKLEKHGDVRIDHYYWMRDRENQEVIDHLNAENDYTKAIMAPQKEFQDELYNEMIARIKPDDSSVPYRIQDYFYYSRYAEGKEYPLYCRKKGSLEAEEEIIIDVNKLAEGKSFCQVGGLSISPNQRYVAYGVDFMGRRIFSIRIKDLQTGETLKDEINSGSANSTWAADNKTLFYSEKDTTTLRTYQIKRHLMGTDSAQDELVFEESDDTFSCYITKSKSREYIMIISSATLTTEYQLLKADNPTGKFEVMEARKQEHEYSVAHFGDHFYILTNDKAENYRLMRTPVNKPSMANWEEVVAHREKVTLEDLELFRDFMVLEERENGLLKIRVMPWEDGEEYYLQFEDPAYTASTTSNTEFDTDQLRYAYTSMTTPASIYEINMKTKERTLLKQQPVLGEFDVEQYTSERIYVTARDGKKVPMSLVRHKDTPVNGTAPLLLYAYGSYGATIDPYFSSARLSLLNRGFIYAIAHIRGGSTLGREWYEDGRLLNKKNTFTDFIDCGKYLVDNNYTQPERLYAMGGSAGGLLMGAVVNMAPELFHGAVAAVPFVDVVTTMLDEDIPLTTGEYREWGNPNEKVYYDYMLSYSPYDNVEAKAYPNLLITSGLHDSQVQYWEPTKWAAKLREMKTDNNLLLLHTNMEAGHGGASGRYEAYKEVALEYTFLLKLAGKI